jgi:hypothetical protein
MLASTTGRRLQAPAGRRGPAPCQIVAELDKRIRQNPRPAQIPWRAARMLVQFHLSAVMTKVTELLTEIDAGDPSAAGRLLPLVYADWVLAVGSMLARFDDPRF